MKTCVSARWWMGKMERSSKSPVCVKEWAHPEQKFSYLLQFSSCLLLVLSLFSMLHQTGQPSTEPWKICFPYTHRNLRNDPCVCLCVRNWPCLVKLNVEKREWKGGMMGVRGLGNFCLLCIHAKTHTDTHTVSLASIEHQQINLLFPLIWWKRRDSLTLRRQFLSPNIPSLSPSLSFSVLCPAISPVLSPTIVSGLSGYC